MARITLPDGIFEYAFSKKREDIYPQDTQKAYYAFSNNDASEKSIWLLLKNRKNVTLDFGGAKLMFHGRITPFLLDGCENVTLRNFTVDYDRPFYTQGEILSSSNSHVELKIGKEFPYTVQDGNLIMRSETWENDLHDGIMLFQEYDPETRSLAYDSPVIVCRVGKDAENDPTSPLPMHLLTAEEGENGALILRGDLSVVYKPGNVLVMTHEKRENPVIGIHGCRNIRLENITVLQSGAMGVIAQLTENISLENIVVHTENKERYVSTNCDSTHFTACAGHISIKNCTFESMMDDGTNIHGVYTRVNRVDAGRIETEIMHFQQFGVCFYRPGDCVNVYRGHSALLRGQLTVTDAYLTAPNKIALVYRTDGEAPEEGDFLENITLTPSVHISGLITGKNRPRGILATTPRDVLIEKCHFRNSGYGIHIAGDTCFWYESGAVKNVVIRDCVFTDCGHNMGDYAIAVTPEFEDTGAGERYHGAITVENNLFESFTDGLVFADSVESVTFRNNVFRKTDAYPKRINTERLTVKRCSSVLAEE